MTTKKLLFLTLITKLLTICLVIIGFYLLSFNKTNYHINFHYPPHSPITLASAFSTWDAQHYLYLSQHGYKPNQVSNWFFPLYPTLIHISTYLISNNLLAGITISNLFFSIGIIYLCFFLKNFLKNPNQISTIIFLYLAFPTSFYFTLPYSESLCFFLTTAFFYHLYKNHFPLVFVLGFLLPLSRPVGFFIIIPLATYLLISYKKYPKHKLSLKSLALIGPILGLFLYLTIMNALTGSALSGYSTALDNRAGWNPLSPLIPQKFLSNLFSPIHPYHTYLNSPIDRFFFLYSATSLFFIYRKLDKTLFAYSLSLVIIPIFGSFTSFSRYLLLIFPIFMITANFLKTLPTVTKILIFIFLIILQITLLLNHITNNWIA